MIKQYLKRLPVLRYLAGQAHHLLDNTKKVINRKLLKPVAWQNLRSVKPVSARWGSDRGQPVDRYYIEKFLSENSPYIKGTALEIADDNYIRKFGSDVKQTLVLHYTGEHSNATIIGDLTKKETLPPGRVDCFICTQTFPFIYDYKAAIEGAHHLLKEGGVVLATMAGISKISRYDMDRWGDYWRFTTLSAFKMFAEVFGEKNVRVGSYGNVLTAIAFLEGMSREELTQEELDHRDPDYQLIITVVAEKKSVG